LNFLNRISKNTEISNFMKNHPVGAGLFYVNRQAGRQDDANSHLPKSGFPQDNDLFPK
jgi:hypothetical protein